MSALITGGAGLLGRSVAARLVARGEAVTVFSRSPTPGRLGDIADSVTAIAGDLGQFSHVLDAVKASRPRVLYHLGAMLSVPSDADPATALQTNALGTYHVLEAARLFDVERVVFASSMATYGNNLPLEPVTDVSLQRPSLFYGATKVFGEQMGLVWRRKYGLDVRGLRYPSIVGPGAETPGIVQYTSRVIEETAKGRPFAIWVPPEHRTALLFIDDAADGTIALADAPADAIKTVHYVIDGPKPTPTADEIAGIVRSRVQGAEITFEPDPEIVRHLSGRFRPLDDSCARDEWGWNPVCSYPDMVDAFLSRL